MKIADIRATTVTVALQAPLRHALAPISITGQSMADIWLRG